MKFLYENFLQFYLLALTSIIQQIVEEEIKFKILIFWLKNWKLKLLIIIWEKYDVMFEKKY
ncbi:hypothetical protein [Spiroplasma endosymbiont of Nomada rufipes]|uniref:hypothetical protein n=1 Tax=Spiroplasma endosymbiont of Nomada rufipes TaxID=3077933 RepID=UPI00376F2CC4